MLAHHHEWHTYAKDVLGLSVKREEIILAIGWVKTSADWKAVAFTSSSTSYDASLEGRAFGVADADLRRKRTRELEPPKMHREGALYPGRTHRMDSRSREAKPLSTRSAPTGSSILDECGDPSIVVDTADSREPTHATASPSHIKPQTDQCAFLKRCMIKKRILFTSVVGGAGSHQLPKRDDVRSGRAGEGLIVGREDEEDEEEDLLNYASEVDMGP